MQRQEDPDSFFRVNSTRLHGKCHSPTAVAKRTPCLLLIVFQPGKSTEWPRCLEWTFLGPPEPGRLTLAADLPVCCCGAWACDCPGHRPSGPPIPALLLGRPFSNERVLHLLIVNTENALKGHL